MYNSNYLKYSNRSIDSSTNSIKKKYDIVKNINGQSQDHNVHLKKIRNKIKFIEPNEIKKNLNKIDEYIKELDQIEKTYLNVGGGRKGGLDELNLKSNLKSNLKTNSNLAQSDSMRKKYKQIPREKYEKFKLFVKFAKNSIITYKKAAESYYSSYNLMCYYYMILLKLLEQQKNILKEKQDEYNHLSDNTKNNAQKIALLESMIANIKKQFESAVNLKIDVASKINGNEVLTNFGAILNKENPTAEKKMYGGLGYEEFRQSIQNELEVLNKTAEELKADNEFASNKIEQLRQMTEELFKDDEALYNISLRIEWLINELEKQQGEEEKDYQSLYDEFIKLVQKIDANLQNKSNIGNDVRNLEAMNSSIFDAIESIKKMFERANHKMNNGKQITNSASFIKENKEEKEKKFNKTQGGGKIMDGYYKKNNEIIEKIIEKINKLHSEEHSLIFFNNFDGYRHFNTLDLFKEKNSYYLDKMIQFLSMWDILRKKIIKIQQLLKSYIESEIKNFNNDYLKFAYSEFFKNLDNDLYIERIKNVECLKLMTKVTNSKNNEDYGNFFIYSINSEYQKFEELENSYVNIINYLLQNEQINIFANFLEYNTLLTTIKQMDNTILFFDFFEITLMFLKKFVYCSQTDLDCDVDINNFIKIINPIKSRSFYSYEYLHKYISDNSGVDLDTYQIEKKYTIQHKIHKGGYEGDELIFQKEYVKIFTKEFFKYTKNFQADKYNSYQNSFKEYLNQMILTILKNISNEMISMNNKSIQQAQDLKLKLDKKLESNTNSQAEEKSHDLHITAPRIDKYKITLQETQLKINKFVESIDEYKKNLETIKGLKPSNSKKDFYDNYIKNIYFNNNELQKNIKSGVNAIIRVNPMIFFAVEFPPQIYMSDKCKNVIEYNKSTEIVTLNINCDVNGEILNGEKNTITHNTNQAFVKYTNNNATTDIMEDPLIGLNQIIKTNSNENEPTNKVISMMFALGASGTGKTSRYFGSDAATNPKDKKGIITQIIDEAKRTNKSSIISIAYFVCYGRINNTDLNFDELLLFFNPAYANFPDNEFVNKLELFDQQNNYNNIMSCYMDINNSNQNTYTDANSVQPEKISYSDYYKKIVEKKLVEIDCDRNFINKLKTMDKIHNLQNSQTDFKTFREIIEDKNDNNIWLELESNTNLEQIFENLMRMQKKLYTILPTRNNIESSRGHTCVLIKINSDRKNKYFPLFDMAGTENTNTMDEFLTKQHNPIKMQNLIKTLSELSIKYNLAYDSSGTFSSLKQVVENDKINKYVENQKGGKDKIIIVEKFDDEGGINENINLIIDSKKERKDIDEKDVTVLQKLNNDDADTNFLNKIVNEGYYINHTIGLLIFVAKCVGMSIGSNITNGDDQFDNINDDNAILNELSSSICLNNNNCDNKTMILYDDLSFNYIITQKTLWLQILFSFLYWNEENENTIKQLINNCINEKIEHTGYLSEENLFNPNDKITIEKNAIQYEDFDNILGLDDNIKGFIEFANGLRAMGVYDEIIQDGNEIINNTYKHYSTLPDDEEILDNVQIHINVVASNLDGYETKNLIEYSSIDNYVRQAFFEIYKSILKDKKTSDKDNISINDVIVANRLL